MCLICPSGDIVVVCARHGMGFEVNLCCHWYRHPENQLFYIENRLSSAMKKILMAIAAAAVIGAVLLSLSMSDQAAIAASDGAMHMDSMDSMGSMDSMEAMKQTEGVNQEYRFTKTIDSALSPGLGHEAHQIVRVLEPSDGIIYSGTLTYVTSEPIDIVVLHEIDNDDARGQAIWRIDDDTVYGWTLVDLDSKAGSFEYAGAGLLLHTGGDAFIATVTVDGSAQESQTLNLTSSLGTP